MKNIVYFIVLLFLTSCHNEPVDFNPVDFNPIDNSIVALDTLGNYSDYILGDFGGNFLVSTNVLSKSYIVIAPGVPLDSSKIQFGISYKLLENNIEKSTSVVFKFMEANTKLDTINDYRYNHFSDFIDFFDRNQLIYYQVNEPINNLHSTWISYKNFYTIDEDEYRFITAEYTQQIIPENFNFYIDSIKVKEDPIKKVEVYYSFKCIGVNSYDDELIMKNGKGKSTFEYN